MSTISARRNASIDIARGIIVALMALDHTRLFLTAARFDPVAVDDTNLAYFFTRWITHLCAPGFFFLAGASVRLAERADRSRRLQQMFLFTRGVWLVVLEFTLIGFAWSLSAGWSWFGVIWSLGASMICLSLLRWAPERALMAGAISLLALHNLIPVQTLIPNDGLRTVLYSAGELTVPGVGEKIALFPLAPWLAVMVLGYASINWLAPKGQPDPRRLLLIGLSGFALFVAARLAGFGQPAGEGFRTYNDWPRTLMSFLNVEKYPPSTQFVLVTLGFLALILALLAAMETGAARPVAFLLPLRIFGRVPFFFYLVHLYVIHIMALIIAGVLRWPSGYLYWRTFEPNLTPPPGFGFDLPGVYGAWLVVLALLFAPCLAFARLKEKSSASWLKYF